MEALILSGVKAGLGRAIAPLHLLQNEPDIVVLEGYKQLLSPVYLVYYHQSFVTKLHQKIINLCQGLFGQGIK